MEMEAKHERGVARVSTHRALHLRPDDVLHIVGPSPDETYSNFLRGRARGKQVHFHGCLPRPEVQQLIIGKSVLRSVT